MSFKQKSEPYGIADGTALVIISTTGGETATNTEAIGEDGSIVANTVTGFVSAPTAELALKAALEKSAGYWKIGAVTTASSKKFALGSIRISTSAGGAPTISIGGNEVQATATTGCYYPVPAFKLTTKHHAQILFSAFRLAGAGCHLITAEYTISGTINIVTKDNEPIAFDVVQGKIEVSVSVKQTGQVAPELTAGDNFQVVSPLAETNPDAEYPTYSATLVRYLEKSNASDSPNQQTTPAT